MQTAVAFTAAEFPMEYMRAFVLQTPGVRRPARRRFGRWGWRRREEIVQVEDERRGSKRGDLALVFGEKSRTLRVSLLATFCWVWMRMVQPTRCILAFLAQH